MPQKILLMANDVTLAHLGRPLQLGKHLHDNGYEVILAASPESARFLDGFPGRVHFLEPTGKTQFIENLANGRPVFDFPRLLRYEEEDERILSSYRPDLVIGDFRITLSISARRQRIPYATITNAYWSPHLSPHFVVPDLPMVRYLGVGISQALFNLARPFAFAYHCQPMNALRRHFGMPTEYDLRNIYTEADLTLFSDVPDLYGISDTSIPDASFLGPIPWSPEIPRPAWWNQLNPDIPVIYLTLGSSGDGTLLPRLVSALQRSDCQLLVASAGAKELPTHERVYCADYLPGKDVVSLASLVICNGGSPTSSQALSNGVPVVGVPGNLDQFLNMSYLETWGAGLSLRQSTLGSPDVAQVITGFGSRPEVRNAAKRLANIYTRYSVEERLLLAVHRLLGHTSRDTAAGS